MVENVSEFRVGAREGDSSLRGLRHSWVPGYDSIGNLAREGDSSLRGLRLVGFCIDRLYPNARGGRFLVEGIETAPGGPTMGPPIFEPERAIPR